MTTKENVDSLIKMILMSYSIDKILDTNNLKKEFGKIAKKIHPDVCSHPKASEATQHLTELRDQFKKGIPFEDDAGPCIWKSKIITYTGDITLLKKSLKNYQKLMSLKDETAKKFQRYLPQKMELKGDSLVVTCLHRSVPISGRKLHIHHSNWILSRLLEFNAWLAQVGYVHCGLTPESVCIVPETHGIIITSFYHMTEIGKRLQTVSAKFKHWYTPSIFEKKTAISLIDSELAKKIAIYLLGDHSGSGIKFKKTHNPETIAFITTQDYISPIEVYKKWRKVLTKNFEITYWPLDI